MSLYTKDMKAYRALLSRKMELATWNEMPFWNQFLGFIGGKNSRYPQNVAIGSSLTKTLKATGKPIEVLTNFMHEGGINMDIPVAYPITEKGVYGDKQLLGTEETRKIAYKAAHINQVRKGVKIRDGLMGEQTLKKPEVQKELMTTAQAELTEWFQKWNGFAVYDGFFRGYSDNITAAGADGGLGFTAKSHPNFYVAGNGKVTWNSTPATYETNVATALNTLAAGDEFDTAVIEAAVYYASQLKIRPVSFGKGSAPYYCMVISPAQAVQLWQDDKWIAAQKDAALRSNDANKLFSGVIEGIYRGAMIFVDSNIFGAKTSADGGYDAARGTVNYGNANPIDNPIDQSPKKLALLFGQSAVACGYASPLKFESETWDYKAKKTEGGSMIVGYERSDIYDHDGYYGTAGAFKENTSSLVMATYSPDSVTF